MTPTSGPVAQGERLPTLAPEAACPRGRARVCGATLPFPFGTTLRPATAARPPTRCSSSLDVDCSFAVGQPPVWMSRLRVDRRRDHGVVVAGADLHQWWPYDLRTDLRRALHCLCCHRSPNVAAVDALIGPSTACVAGARRLRTTVPPRRLYCLQVGEVRCPQGMARPRALPVEHLWGTVPDSSVGSASLQACTPCLWTGRGHRLCQRQAIAALRMASFIGAALPSRDAPSRREALADSARERCKMMVSPCQSSPARGVVSAPHGPFHQGLVSQSPPAACSCRHAAAGMLRQYSKARAQRRALAGDSLVKRRESPIHLPGG